MATSYLCIGGPRAGQRMKTRDDAQFFRVTIPPPLSVSSPYDASEPTRVQTVEYRIQQIAAGPEETVRFWVPSTQSPMETMELLLEAYEIYKTRRET